MKKRIGGFTIEMLVKAAYQVGAKYCPDGDAVIATITAKAVFKGHNIRLALLPSTRFESDEDATAAFNAIGLAQVKTAFDAESFGLMAFHEGAEFVAQWKAEASDALLRAVPRPIKRR